MGFGDGFRMGMGLLEQSAREKQQTQENAWKQKQMDAWQADQDFKTSERNNFLGLRSKAADAQEANDTAGFEAPGFNAPYAVESESGGYTGNGPVKLQIAPEQRTQQGMQRDFMRAAPDVQSVMALQEKATRDRAFNEGMALRSYLTSLPKETLDQHMGELSDSSRNGYKVQKTKGGYSVMVEGGEPIKMTRDQAMDWLSSRHVYNKTGDATALARMEKIDGVLASQAKTRFDQQKGATEAGNTATRYGNMDQKDAAQLGLQQQRLAQQSNAERMGQIQYFQDPKSGEVKGYIPSAGRSGGVNWNEVEVPEGMAPMRAGGAKGAGGAQALKYEVQNQWGEVEKKLRQDNTPEPQVQAQRDGFFAMRGVAPESEYSAILSGRDPKTGNALTKDDVERFSRVYPLSPVDPNSLSWLKPKASTDSARSQQRGLVEPKYIRSPGPRGGYEYTESPRGLTRADYATIDAQRAPR